MSRIVPGADWAASLQIYTPPKTRGRPRGPGKCYGGSSLSKRPYRGIRGGATSNRRLPGQAPLQHLPSPADLAEVVRVARQHCKLNSSGHFIRRSFQLVKREFPEMSLADSTIRRCFHHGDFIIREARETRSLRQSHRLDNCSGPTRFRKGLRKKGNQGRPLECSAVVFEVGSWHEEQRRQQIWVGEEELSLEFEELLEAHCKALQTIRRVEPLPPFLEHELECMHRRLDQLKDSNRRRQVLDRLRKALGAVGYAIQKITDLSASEQFLRMTRYWQHLDWMYHMIKSKNVAVLQGILPGSSCLRAGRRRYCYLLIR